MNWERCHCHYKLWENSKKENTQAPGWPLVRNLVQRLCLHRNLSPACRRQPAITTDAEISMAVILTRPALSVCTAAQVKPCSLRIIRGSEEPFSPNRVEKRNFPREELGLLVSASLPDLLPCPLLQHCFALCVSLCNTVHTLSVKTCVGTGKYMQLISVRGYLHLPAQCYCMYSTYTLRAGIQGKQVHSTVVRLINIRWWSLSSLKHYLLDIILLTVIFFRIC